jgi:glutamine amidotransferase
MILIVDYGMGNLGSVLNMLKRADVEAIVSGRVEDVMEASKIILPGVGAFGQAMENLEQTGLAAALKDRVERHGIPILGICLGMQLLTESSEEGNSSGFGWIPGTTVRFRQTGASAGLKIPHMGWNLVTATQPNPLLPLSEEERRFYFVHSYHVACAPEYVIGSTTYGYPFASAIRHRNVLGAQFHPEKSHRFGSDLLSRFAGWEG